MSSVQGSGSIDGYPVPILPDPVKMDRIGSTPVSLTFSKSLTLIYLWFAAGLYQVRSGVSGRIRCKVYCFCIVSVFAYCIRLSDMLQFRYGDRIPGGTKMTKLYGVYEGHYDYDNDCLLYVLLSACTIEGIPACLESCEAGGSDLLIVREVFEPFVYDFKVI